MALSVLERIASNVQSTIGSLTTLGGYTLNITRARQINAVAHLNGYIFQLSPADVPDPEVSTDEWKQAFAVVVYVMPAEDDTTPVDTYNNDIAASLYTSLMADYSRGGLAINTIIAPTLYFPPVEGDTAGITFMFDVHYRTAIDKPYVSQSA